MGVTFAPAITRGMLRSRPEPSEESVGARDFYVAFSPESRQGWHMTLDKGF